MVNVNRWLFKYLCCRQDYRRGRRVLESNQAMRDVQKRGQTTLHVTILSSRRRRNGGHWKITTLSIEWTTVEEEKKDNQHFFYIFLVHESMKWSLKHLLFEKGSILNFRDSLVTRFHCTRVHIVLWTEEILYTI